MNTPSLQLTDDQVAEFQTILAEVKGGWAEIKALPATLSPSRMIPPNSGSTSPTCGA